MSRLFPLGDNRGGAGTSNAASGAAMGEPAPRVALPAWVRYGIAGILVFLLTGTVGAGVERGSAIVACVLLAVSLLGAMPRWAARNRVSLPALAVCLYFLLNCAAGLYTRFGGFAAVEFGKILTAFCVFLTVLLHARRGEIRCLAAMGAAVCAAYGFLSVDAASIRSFSTIFIQAMDGLFGTHFMGMETGYEAGIRITGVFGNPNFMAGFLALGIFLSLYLVRAAGSRRERLAACLLLGLNTFSFLLLFSMGAVASFVVAVLLYLAAERRERRVSLFILLAETAFTALLFGFVAMPGLGSGQGALGIVPDLAGFGNGLVLWALHEFGGLRLSQHLERRKRETLIAAGVLAGGLCLYVLLGFQLTGAYTLDAGETLRRSVYPEAGTYTLEGDWTGEISVTVESQNTVDTIVHTSTVLYSGPLEGASFTVPEGTRVVYLNFQGGEGDRLESLSLSNGPRVKLGYLLFPGFIANRIQGLWANQNAIQRLAFFQDGLRIYAQSPIIGNGLGSFVGQLFSVQDFYYETTYVHNHYIQVLLEMGIPGLISFLVLLGSAAVTLLRRRREGEDDHLLPALLGCLAVSALHALTEIDWSVGVYQIMALLVLGLVAVRFARPLPRTGGKAAGIAVPALPAVVCLVFAVLLSGNLYAENIYSEVKIGLREQTADTMSQLAAIDRYNWAQYELDMAVNAAQSSNEKYASIAARYIEDCRALKIYTINQSLETYVYLPMGRYEEFFQASREGIPQAASKSSTWQQEFSLYEVAMRDLSLNAPDQLSWFADQVALTYEMLMEYNQGRLSPITLTEQNLAFLDRVLALDEVGLNGEEALTFLESVAFDS
ncbi:O-antigen ligase family protein [Intestinimonas butyriciproducens]|uniref:O-antigen ligase family protein n=1 Tax=Intestinimonas butyriciproducens TaxID=1297617 RepID=UPI00195BBF24|nr:O-antigen ligase family protein [Intestinimonas butyriciproducens]MBM6977551.1 O-antigen ligase family protein [Intestinimonas butyriciproducens]